MYKKIELWWKTAGWENVGVGLAGLGFWWLVPGSLSNGIGFILLGMFIAFNWMAIKHGASILRDKIKEKTKK